MQEGPSRSILQKYAHPWFAQQAKLTLSTPSFGHLTVTSQTPTLCARPVPPLGVTMRVPGLPPHSLKAPEWRPLRTLPIPIPHDSTIFFPSRELGPKRAAFALRSLNSAPAMFIPYTRAGLAGLGQWVCCQQRLFKMQRTRCKAMR